MLLGAAKAHGYSNDDVIVKMSTNPQKIFCLPVQEDTCVPLSRSLAFAWLASLC